MRFISSALIVFCLAFWSSSAELSFESTKDVKGAAYCNVSLNIPFACGDPEEPEYEGYCGSLHWDKWYQISGTQNHRVIDDDNCFMYSGGKCGGFEIHEVAEDSTFCTLDIIFF